MPDPRMVIEAEFDIEGGYAAAAPLLDLAEPPTAIFAFNDQLAIGAMQIALARGVRIPEDLSIVGFDDTAEAALFRPAVTTVRQPLAEMGRMGVSLLTRRIRAAKRVERSPGEGCLNTAAGDGVQPGNDADGQLQPVRVHLRSQHGRRHIADL
jgi:DNA-binding LacI/PurR family transcriptional regulator